VADVAPTKPQDRNRAILRSTLEPEARLVALAIADHMDAAGEAWPCADTLATETGYSERTVRDVLTHGIETGWLAFRWRPGRMRVLRIVWDRLADVDRPTRNAGTRRVRRGDAVSEYSDPERGAGSNRNGAPEREQPDPAPAAGTNRNGAPVDPERGAGSNRNGAPTKQTSEATMKQTSEATIARAGEDDRPTSRKADAHQGAPLPSTEGGYPSPITSEEDPMQLFGKEIPHPADTRIVDPPKAPPLPSWVPKDTKPYARADVAAMVLAIVAEHRRPADLAPSEPSPPIPPIAGDVRCKGDAKTILALWSYLERPPLGEFAADVIAVIRAAKPGGCPHRKFARDIRAEGWPEGTDRHRDLSSVLVHQRWETRLEMAREWVEHPETFAAAPTKTRESLDFDSMYRRYRSDQPVAK